MPFNDPAKAREYQRTYKRLRRAGDCQTPGTTRLPAEFRLRTAADVLAILDEQVAAVREDQQAGTLERARCIGYMAAVALKAIEAGNLAARLEGLEQALKLRTLEP